MSTQKSILQAEYLAKMREKYPHKYDQNPMVRLHGYGPDGKQCGDCANHVIKRMANDYHKCKVWLKPLTGGPGTDIRVRWRACGKFAETNPLAGKGVEREMLSRPGRL